MTTKNKLGDTVNDLLDKLFINAGRSPNIDKSIRLWDGIHGLTLLAKAFRDKASEEACRSAYSEARELISQSIDVDPGCDPDWDWN